MDGYEVVATGDERLGHVVEVVDDYLIIEYGRLRKTRHALPLTFAHPDDGSRTVRMTVSKEIFCDSPKIEGPDWDREAVAAHYGLAETDGAPAAEGYGDTVADDPAFGPDEAARTWSGKTAEEERAEIRESIRPEGTPTPGDSPALLGNRNRDR